MDRERRTSGPSASDCLWPFIQMLFGTEALPFRYWIITFLIGFAMFMIVEVEKVLTRRWRTTKR
jgi:hypothetical protein